VPSPNVSEDHQTKNARALVDKDAAILVADADARTKLVDQAIELLHDEGRMKSLSSNIRELALPNATEDIVQEILALAKEKK
jgi:UDP-N-acetylglucosamine--N-acetylmuramyl-(pentapeptide) pyrophosphoryl-undecaprenol N-acetylglucosamine transferase